MRKLRISAAVEHDLDQSWLYIATNSASLERANRFVELLAKRLLVLATAPRAGTVRDEIEAGVRALPIGDYIVYYREAKKHIIVSRIIHGSREQGTAYTSGQ